MSEHDLPERIKEYGGDHIELRRIALTTDLTGSLPSFCVETKSKDTRYRWFKKTYGDRCWELDAMDPNDLRALVEREIEALIDRPLWEQQERLQERDIRSIDLHMNFLQQEDRERQATESHLRHLAIFQNLNTTDAAG